MSARDLSELRNEVDRLDDAMLDLLIERMAVVQHIASLKGDRDLGRLALRPAREAMILRRLTARARGRFPAASLLQMWRELLGATTSAQAPLRICVWEPEGRGAIRDLARNHFGTLAPVRSAETAEEALRSLGDGSAQIAVLPLPEEADRWWRSLLGDGSRPLHVVSRLPFLDGSGHSHPQAFAVAALDPEPSGEDLSLLVFETAPDISCARLCEALHAAGLAPRPLATLHDGAESSVLHLIELNGFLTPGEAPLAACLEPLGRRILRVTPIGGYPRPLSEAELG
ncbi:chorismate mutase (plasmid) [Geminicoccaceae bacterium 1502E]|nr:chorismate mutase [Geminicoccaceae bacterium 1502E]